jgi:hypothetical protein
MYFEIRKGNRKKKKKKTKPNPNLPCRIGPLGPCRPAATFPNPSQPRALPFPAQPPLPGAPTRLPSSRSLSFSSPLLSPLPRLRAHTAARRPWPSRAPARRAGRPVPAPSWTRGRPRPRARPRHPRQPLGHRAAPVAADATRRDSLLPRRPSSPGRPCRSAAPKCPVPAPTTRLPYRAATAKTRAQARNRPRVVPRSPRPFVFALLELQCRCYLPPLIAINGIHVRRLSLSPRCLSLPPALYKSPATPWSSPSPAEPPPPSSPSPLTFAPYSLDHLAGISLVSTPPHQSLRSTPSRTPARARSSTTARRHASPEFVHTVRHPWNVTGICASHPNASPELRRSLSTRSRSTPIGSSAPNAESRPRRLRSSLVVPRLTANESLHSPQG